MTQHYKYVKSFLYKKEADYLYDRLDKEIPWSVVKYYKPERGYVITPRETWCAGIHNRLDLKNFNYQWNKIPKWLLPLKQLVEDECNEEFNFMLFAKYRNENDSITFHSDDERFLGDNPTIASITVGETRPFQLKNKVSREIETFNLSHGDLFVMQNNCQKDYLHSVPKQKEELSTRISITFRKGLNMQASRNYYTYNTQQNIF